VKKISKKQQQILVVAIFIFIILKGAYSKLVEYRASKVLNSEAIPHLTEKANFVFNELGRKDSNYNLDIKALSYLRECFSSSVKWDGQKLYLKYTLTVNIGPISYLYTMGYLTDDKRIVYYITKYQDGGLIVRSGGNMVSNCKFADFIQRFDIPVKYYYSHERQIWGLEEGG
jgi:hypothetical protein